MNLKEFLKMPSGKRRKIDAHKHRKAIEPRKPSLPIPRPSFTDDELTEYMRVNKIRTWRQLHRIRKPADPMRRDYHKAFGSWSQAKEEAWKHHETSFAALHPDSPPASSPERLMRLCVVLNIWTREKWRSTRQIRPDMVPSENQVLKHFGRFSNMFHYALKTSSRKQVEKYVKLWKQLGRTPSNYETAKAGIDLTDMLGIWESKLKLDNTLALGLREWEKRKKFRRKRR